MKYLKSYNEIYKQKFNDLDSLDEGFKEIALSILMLSGGNLNAQNRNLVKKSLDNIEIVKQIDNTLNNSDKLQVVINKVSNKLPGAGKLIQKNAYKVKASIENIINKNNKVKETETNDVNVLIDRLRQGYAISDIQITKDTLLPVDTIVTIGDEMEVNWSSDNFFKSGTFELSNESKDSIKLVISSIVDIDVNIESIEIISSTDKEPIRMGNDKLAKLRADAVKSEVNKLYNGNVNIKTLPNSGDDVYSKNMSSSDRKIERINTSKYRYVRLKIILSENIEIKNKLRHYEDIVDKFNYKLVRLYNNIDNKTKTIKKTKHKTFCKSIKIKHRGKYKTVKCPIF